MRKFVIAPDSFKGSISSQEFCEIVSNNLTNIYPHAKVESVPLADGGEGTLDVLSSNMLGWILKKKVQNPFGQKIEVRYLQNATTFFIEIAEIVGLCKLEKLDIENASTFGVGQLILEALNEDVSQIVLTLGGSASQDGGCGMAAALGYRFFDENGNYFIPAAKKLDQISRIEKPEENILRQIYTTKIISMCDVENTLYGPNGAAYVFGLQKGAKREDLARYDRGLRHLAQIIHRDIGVDISDLVGGGAAGGLGGGVKAFLGSKLQSGIATILDLVDFENIIDDETIIITGEGKIDAQSFQGKVLSGLISKANYAGAKILIFAGQVGEGLESLQKSAPILDVLCITPQGQNISDAMKYAKENLQKVTKEYFHNFSSL